MDVTLAGYGRIGEVVGQLLAARHIPFLAIDVDMRCVEEGRKHGAPVYFGDASQPEVLRTAGVERAAGAVITLDDPEPARQIVGELRCSHPDLVIATRSRDAAHGRGLEEAGACPCGLRRARPHRVPLALEGATAARRCSPS